MPFPSLLKVTAALVLYTTGALLHPLASTVGVSRSLIRRAPHFLVFPSPDTQHITKSTCMDVHGLPGPGVFSVIDCTHISLVMGISTHLK